MIKKYSLVFLAFFCAITFGFGQTEEFNLSGGGAFPSGWSGTNNITANDIDRSSYYLVEAGNPSDLILTDSYDLSGYTSVTFDVDIRSFGSGAHNSLKVEVSVDNGANFTQTYVTPITTTSYTNHIVNISTFSANTVIRLSNNGTSGRGVRLQNLILTGYNSSSCSISDISISNAGSCNDNGTPADASDDYYLGDVNITFSNPPASGNIDLTGSGVITGGATSAVVGSSVQTISGVRLAANGSNVEITATFSAETTCNYTETVSGSAVTNCSSSGPSCASVFADDFSGTLSQWSNVSDWTISGGELKHNLSSTESESYIYADMGNQSLSSGDYQWDFCMRNGSWDPSGGNDFTYYLISDDSDLQTNATGYAVGVNRVGTSDLLTLYEVNSGTHSAIITSAFNWGSNHDVCIKVTRNTSGLWELLYSVNGGSEVSAGTVTDTSHTSGQYTGAFFDFSSSRAGQLWIDDINICGTPCTTPVNPTTFSSSVGCTGIDLSWDTPGCAEEVLIVARDGSAVTAIPIGDGSAYTDNTIFGSGTALSAGQYDVYEGTGTTATITGLTNGNTYHFTVYSRVGSTWSSGVSVSTAYNLTVNNVPTFTTYNSCGDIALNWSLPACYDEVLIVGRNGSAVTASPSGDGSAYTDNLTFGSGTALLAGQFDVYEGTGTSALINGLTNGNTYHFTIFTRIGTAWSSGVSASATAVSSGGSGPTTFIPGDLVFVGFDSYIGGGNDRFSILNMVDIGVGTEFTMANLLYEYNAPAGISTGRWYDCNDDFDEAGEPPYATLRYDGCSDIPKGSVICIETNSFPAVVIGITVNGVDATADFTVLNNASHSNDNIAGNISTSNPDAIWLMQGTFTDVNTEPDGPDTADSAPDNFRTFSGVVLGGLQTKGNFQPFSSAGNAGGTRISRIHPDIECVYLETGPTSSSRFYGYHNSGMTSGTHYALLANITDVTNNWTIQSAGSGQTADDIVSTCNSSYTVTGSANVAGHWIGGVSTDWFDCKNWENFSVPKRDTNVTIDNTSTTFCDIDHTSPNAAKYGYVADCQDLTISDESLNIENDLDILYVRNVTIQGTGSLDMNHDGSGTPGSIIYLYEDWTNNIGINAFDEGNGHVIFSGDPLDGPQVINNNVPANTEEFYNVTIDNDFDTSTSNNLHANGNLIVDPTNTVTVSDGRYIYANNNFTNNGTFNIENNGSLVQGSDSGVNTGNISVERSASVDAQDYVYWSSPVTGINVNTVSPSSPTNRIYKWNPTFANTNTTLGNWVSAAGETMLEGVGYIIRVPSGQTPPPMPGDLNFTATFANGVPHNGPITSPALQVTRGSIPGEDDEWNLIGNPYPSAIDAYIFLDQNSTLLDGFVNLWTHGNPPTSTTDPFYFDFGSNYYESDYLTYNGMGMSSGPGDLYIASGQSFMVNMLDTASSGSNVVFSNTMRGVNHDNSQFYKLNKSQKNKEYRNAEKHRIWLDLVSENQPANRILVGFTPGATNEKDHMFDAISDNLNFYSLIGSKEFVIQGLGLPFDNNAVIPLGYKSNTQGNYYIAIATIDGLFENDNQIIYLKDNLIGITHNLNEQPYSFTSESGTFNNRFEIVFRSNSLSVDDFISNTNNLTIVELENNFVKFNINSNSLTIDGIEIFDLTGKSIYKFIGAKNTSEIINLSNLSSSAYIAKVTLSNNQVITKRAIKK